MNFEVYAQKAQLPQDAILVMKNNYEKIGAMPMFSALCKQIYDDVSFKEIQVKLEAFAESVSVNRFELMLLVLMETCDKMEKNFESLGFSEQNFLDTVKDFQYKTRECFELDGVYGISPFSAWYQKIYDGEIITLGRLQYQIKRSEYSKFTVDGIEVLEGDPVYNLHIPSSGPLLPEDVTESFRMACEFFDERVSGKLILTCSSWLLYPPYKERVFANGSNLWSFADRFHIVSRQETEKFGNAWRVFATRDVSDLSALPADTSLRRSFIRYMREGGTHGSGFGVIALDQDRF